MRPGKDLTAGERATLDQLCQRHELRDPAHRFTDLIRHRVPDAAQRVDRWVTDAAQTIVDDGAFLVGERDADEHALQVVL
jgi:hypothetical protein